MLERIVIECLLCRERVTARRPSIRARAGNLVIAKVLRRSVCVGGCFAERLCRRIEQSGSCIQQLLPVVNHESIFIATCFNWVYSSIE